MEKRFEGMSNTITLAKQEKAASCACCRLTRKTQTQTCFLAHLNSDQKNERDQGAETQLGRKQNEHDFIHLLRIPFSFPSHGVCAGHAVWHSEVCSRCLLLDGHSLCAVWIFFFVLHFDLIFLVFFCFSADARLVMNWMRKPVPARNNALQTVLSLH